MNEPKVVLSIGYNKFFLPLSDAAEVVRKLHTAVCVATDYSGGRVTWKKESTPPEITVNILSEAKAYELVLLAD